MGFISKDRLQSSIIIDSITKKQNKKLINMKLSKLVFPSKNIFGEKQTNTVKIIIKDISNPMLYKNDFLWVIIDSKLPFINPQGSQQTTIKI